MNNFNVSSPPTNDTITKLQNLLNNTLNSLIDVFNNLSYVGNGTELNIESAETSEYNEFAKKLKELEAETNGHFASEAEENEKKEGNSECKEVTIENVNDEEKKILTKEKVPDVFVKPHFDESVKMEILDRVERLYFILEKINECIDELPNDSFSEEEKCKEMKFLQKLKDEKMLELKELYNKYDYLYNSIRQSLRETAAHKN